VVPANLKTKAMKKRRNLNAILIKMQVLTARALYSSDVLRYCRMIRVAAAMEIIREMAAAEMERLADLTKLTLDKEAENE